MIMEKTTESKGDTCLWLFQNVWFRKEADFIIVLEFISSLNVFDVHFIIWKWFEIDLLISSKAMYY